MQPEGQIRHRLNQALYRHLKREIRTSLSRRPENCKHNGVVSSSSVKLHLCLLPNNPGQHDVCDAAHGGVAKAAGCPYFECKHTKEAVKAEFAAFIKDGDRAEVAEYYPDIAAYFWVLGMEGMPELIEPEDPPAPKPEVPVVWYPVVAGEAVDRLSRYSWCSRQYEGALTVNPLNQTFWVSQ